MAAEMERQQAVGLAIGIIEDGEIVYLKGYGFEDREAGIPVTTETMFRWASISKTLTAVVAMQLEAEGILNLDADVRTYVPEFPDKGQTITARQLLCHQSGIVHYKNGKVIRTRRSYDLPNPFEDVVLALDTFAESPLIAEPGEKYSYSTHAFILLSAVLQRAAKERFASLVDSRISNELGMETLQPDYQWLDIPHRAVGYRLRNGEIVESTDTDVSWKLGGGGFISSIEDLAKYAAGLINGELLSEEMESRMWVRQKTRDGKETGVGLGIFVDESDGRLKVSHGGSQEKTKTQLVVYPREGHGVVVMSNSENVAPGKFIERIYEVLGY